MTKVQKIALPACILLIFAIALAIRAFQHKPVPPTPTPQPVAARAAIVLDKTPPAARPEPAPIKGTVPLTHSLDVLEMAASPLQNDLLVATESALNSSGEPDDFGGVLYYVRLGGAKPEAQELMSGNNVNSGKLDSRAQ